MTQAAAQPAAGPATRVPYRVRLHQMESCNCSHGCNCQFEGYPREGRCEFIVGAEVIEGRFGDVSLDGLRFVLACKYPKAIHEGNGTVALFVDRSARPAQVEALGTILSGKAGGMPWEALAATVTTLKGPVMQPIEMKVDGIRSTFRIPGILEVRHTPIKDVVSGEDKEVQIVYPKGGFFWNRGDICTTAVMRVDYDGVSFDHAGHYAAYATATWTNQA